MRALIATAGIAVCVLLSILLAHWGEPQSAWMWCQAIGFEVCE